MVQPIHIKNSINLIQAKYKISPDQETMKQINAKDKSSEEKFQSAGIGIY